MIPKEHMGSAGLILIAVILIGDVAKNWASVSHSFHWIVEAVLGILLFTWPLVFLIAYVLGGLVVLWIAVRVVRNAWRG